jgi:predicted nucleic acid-binding protein
MTTRYADSFFYLALINRSDAAHKRAIELAQDVRRAVVTSAWILTEVGDALADPNQRGNFVKLLERLRLDPQTLILPPQENHFDAGYRLSAGRSDKSLKSWSLTH